MKHRIEEINIDTKDGGSVYGLIKVKTHEELYERINKMLKKGELQMGCLKVMARDIAHMELRLQWVH